jgi:hypothetical protein
MRKWCWLLALFTYIASALAVAFFLPVGARAQGEVEFSAVEIDLWPEYDRPAVLVIQRFSLASEISLPASLTIRIPATATVNAVASMEVGGALVNIGYGQQIQGEWEIISFSTASRDNQIEYYDELIMSETSRHYVFLWPGDYAVDSFIIQFQMPMDASNLQSKPALPNSNTGADGLSYHSAEFGPLAADQAFSLDVTYQKTTDTLSAPSLDIQPSENPANTTGRVTLMQYMPWVLGILGVILIIFGLVAGLLYWQGRRKNLTGDRRQRHASRVEKPEESTAEIYCHQCGRRAQSGDVFCRACGMRLRHGE